MKTEKIEAEVNYVVKFFALTAHSEGGYRKTSEMRDTYEEAEKDGVEFLYRGADSFSVEKRFYRIDVWEAMVENEKERPKR